MAGCSRCSSPLRAAIATSWIDCIAHQPESARRGCWTRSTGFRSSAHYGCRISIWLTCPPGRLRTLARYAALSKAQAIQRMPDERQIATLLAFARVYESVAQDDAVDLLHQFIGTKLLRAEHTGERERLRTLRDLDASALRLREICLIILDPL